VKSRKKNKRKPAKRARGKTYTRPSAETQAPAPLSTQQKSGKAIISPQKARTISTGIIPGQFAGVPGWWLTDRATQPTQTQPNHPYFPDLWSRPTEQNEQQGPNPKEAPEPSANTAEGHPADRRAMVNAYIEEVFSTTGKRITRTDIWKSVGYKARTEFERWERSDPKKVNKTANERFIKILSHKSHLK
jgi:hypothetical protein